MNTSSDDGAIAFVCAMPIEIQPLVQMLSLTRTEIGGTPMHTGVLDGRTVVAIVTGMGMPLATRETTRLLDAVAVRWVLVVGITGAVGSSRVDLQACKLEYSIVSPK